MSEYEENSPLCWRPARATFVIPPGRSDHEPCRPAGKAYGGPVSLSVVPQRLVSCYAMTRFEHPSVVP